MNCSSICQSALHTYTHNRKITIIKTNQSKQICVKPRLLRHIHTHTHTAMLTCVPGSSACHPVQLFKHGSGATLAIIAQLRLNDFIVTCRLMYVCVYVSIYKTKVVGASINSLFRCIRYKGMCVRVWARHIFFVKRLLSNAI